MAGRFSIEAVFRAVDKVTAPVTRMQNRVGKFIRKMERGLRSVNRVLDKTIRGLASGARVALKFGGAAVAAGVTAAALAINKVATAADDLAKRTRRIDFPIEEFQEWQFVAEQSGIAQELFDKSMEKFVKTVGEARAGTGTLVTILKKTNKPLLRQLLATKNSADAFDIYVQALRSTENVLDRTALATAAFGRTGAKFLNITEQSSDAIAALRKEQRENGVITAQQAKEAEKYNDALNSLKRSLFGLLQTVILPMLPKLTETLRVWREWVVANKEMVASRVFDFLIKTKDAIVGFSDKLILVLKSVAGFLIFIAVLKTLTTVIAAVNLVMALNPIGLLVLGIVAAVAAGAALIIWIDEISKGLDKLPAIFKVAFAPLYLAIKAIKAIKDIGAFLGKKLGSLAFDIFGESAADKAEAQAAATPQVVPPQERAAALIEESRTTSTAEVTIRDETGRAEVTRGTMGAGLTLESSGAM